MTVRLLRASRDPFAYDGPREVLSASGDEPVAATGSWRISYRLVPLFRQGGHGLEQAMRVRLSGGVPRAEVTCEMEGGNGHSARCEVVLDEDGAGSAELFFPEVDSPQSGHLRARSADEVVGEGDVVLSPQRKWSVFIVQHSHLDIGYTDRQSVVLRNHGAYLDSVLRLADATGDWSEDSRFRWTVESAFSAFRWYETRTDAEASAMTRLLREGRVELTAFPFQLHTEACSTDELYRLVKMTRDFASHLGVEVVSAMHTDVPGLTAGTVDLLADAGVRYLSAAHNWAGRSVPYLVGGQDLSRPFWWRSASGKRVLVWFTDTPHGMAYMEGNIVGLAEGFASASRYLPDYLRLLGTKPYPYGGEVFGWSGLPAGMEPVKDAYSYDSVHVRVQGADADNASPSIVPASVVREWNTKYAYPRLRCATNREFFTDAEERFGADIPEFEGDWTDWWADGLGSGARPLGSNRKAQALLRVAETVHAITSSAEHAGAGPDGGDAAQDDGHASARADAATIDRLALDIGLFDEHTWGAHLPWDDHEDGDGAGALQWARKSEFAYRAFDDVTDLVDAAVHRLARRIGTHRDALASVVVVNSHPRARTDVAEAFLPATVVPIETDVALVDPRTGERIPHREVPVLPEDFPTRPTGRRLQFLVEGVPATGYVRVDIVAGRGRVDDAPLESPLTIENERYRVVYDVDEACISSLVERTGGRQLVNGKSVAGMNQYIYDRYGTAGGFDHLSGRVNGDLGLLGRRSAGTRAVVKKAVRTAVGDMLTVVADGEGVRSLETRLWAPRCVGRVEIRNKFHKLRAEAKESIYFAFPFAHSTPPVAWELPGNVGGSGIPTVPGSAEHMRAVRHWVAFEEGPGVTAWATLEAPLVQFGNIKLPYAPFPDTLRLERREPSTLYSWVLNNVWDTNFPAQQEGETTFHFAVASAAGTSPRSLGAATAAALTDRLVTAVTGPGIAGDSATGALLEVENDLVDVVAIRPSGEGLEIWLRSLASAAVSVPVRLPSRLASRARAGTVFAPGEPLAVEGGVAQVTMAPGAVVKLEVA